MARQLKVYGWTGVGRRVGGPAQVRMVVAAHSMAEVLRLAGIPRSEYAWSGCETNNDVELGLALACPGVIYWQPLNRMDGTDWTAVKA